MSRWYRRAPLAVALAATVVVASACADEAPSEPAAGTGPDGGAAATGATAPNGPTTTGSGGAGSDAGGGRYDYGTDDGGGDMGGGGSVTLTADNFAFDPAQVELAAGTEISVKNANGSTPHTFTVDGTDIDLELDPGEVGSAALDLEAGEYAFFCRFHPQMTGTLTVS
jgi:plastocyanin